ncbi:MAG: deoxyguanosinetriphosphate triphosphohydrolase [Alphaproteobacteria bacterium]|nr:deoxyguanosinetriphosphate triphosphohydrolase [Alphaproteobacteria bacterium]
MTLANYATHAQQSRGRMYPDFTNIIRSPFQRDRDRLIHSMSFRRLDGKTQVFAYHEGKNYRTRLTHSMEVAQITRTLCKSLHLNEELGEAIALAHDLGHSPFGHAGERGLQKVMKPYGGFDHNIQALRIITEYESHYPEFPGLNLSWETLEGMVKHHGKITGKLNPYLKKFNKAYDLELKYYSSLEAQIAALADDIAYLNHDIDDGFRAGFYIINDLRELPFINRILNDLEQKHQNIDDNIRIYAITRNTIAKMVFDILEQTQYNLQQNTYNSCDDIRHSVSPIASHSAQTQKEIQELRQFLYKHFYNHTNVVRMDMKSQRVIEELFNIFMSDWHLLPTSERNKISSQLTNTEIAGIICTYIANMTDMGALEEHQKLFNNMSRF